MTPRPIPRGEPQFGFGKSLAFSLILISAVLVFAELGIRGWALYLRDDAERWDSETETFVLVPGEHRSRVGTAKINSEGFVGRELETDGPDLWRIVAVGDSCTYGAGDDVHTYPAMLGGLLASLGRPDVRYEVVNAGISGLNSELALRRLRTAVLPLDPDVVTIYVGWNDLMKFDPVAQSDGARWSGVARVLDKLWLVKGMRKLLFFYIRPYVRPPKTGAESRTGRFAGFQPTFYEQNVREMIRAVREAGAAPLLVTLPTVVRPDMTLAELRHARVIFPYFTSAYGVGDFLDLVGAYNASIRRLGREEAVPVVDLASRFERLERPELYFWDTMHLSPKGMRLASSEVLAGLREHELLADGEASP